MNRNASSWLIPLVTAVAGILLIVWYREVDLFSWLIRALGIMLVVPGLYILINALSYMGGGGRPKVRAEIITPEQNITVRKRSVAWSLLIVSAATVMLGFWMLLSPTFFTGLISYLFAVVLIICGVFQLADIIYFSKPVRLPIYFYIAPTLLVIAGVVILCTSVKDINNAVTLLTGILLVVYSISVVAQDIIYRRLTRKIDAVSNRSVV